MERTILSSEFKGAIWHRFFKDEKDETLRSIFNEKVRFYKLYYPFLEKKQILGKTYEELGIPHVCGEVNRKELYKLFLLERKKEQAITKGSRKSKKVSEKYPSLIIEKKSKCINTLLKKPALSSIKQIPVKVNKIQNTVEKSTNDLAFDNLFSNTNSETVRKEGIIQNGYFKQQKRVRFNDGVEIHRVSPAQPIHKLKRVGRLFDEPSSVRSINTKEDYYQEDLFDSDSEFDADTGIISDNEDYDMEEPLQISPQQHKVDEKQICTHTQIIDKEKMSLQKTIYDSAEESYSTDSDTAKLGNNLILSSKMVSVAQGKWLRETERIVRNNHESHESEKSSSMVEDEEFIKCRIVTGIVRIEKNTSIDEYILEKIKCLQISTLSELKNVCSETLTSTKQIMPEVKKEKVKIENELMEKEGLVTKEIMSSSDSLSKELSINTKRNNLKISLENDVNSSLIEENDTFDTNKLSYVNDVFVNTNIGTDNNLEVEIRGKPDKLLDDNSNLINDWSSTNENISDKSLSKDYSSYSNDSEQCLVKSELCNVKGETIEEDLDSSMSKERSNIEEKDAILLLVDSDCSEQKSLLTDKSDPFHSDKTHQSIEGIKPAINTPVSESRNMEQASIFSNKIILGEGSFIAHDSIYLDASFTIKSETLEENALKVNYISPNKSISNLNELCSTIYSLITKPIIVQSEEIKECNHGICTESQIPINLELKKDQLGSNDSEHNFSKFNVDKPLKPSFSSTNILEISEPSGQGRVNRDSSKKQIMNIENKTDEKELFNKIQILKNVSPKHNSEELEKEVQFKSIEEPQRTSVISMASTNEPKCVVPGDYEGRMNANKDSVHSSDACQNQHWDQLGNKSCDLEQTDLRKGHDPITSESSGINYLSKVQMWSIHSKESFERLTMPSETTSLVGSCNTDLLQREVINETEGGARNHDYWMINSELESNLDLTSISSPSTLSMHNDEEVNTSESNAEDFELKSIEEQSVCSESSFSTVTPVKSQDSNSDKLSTAYETDPETGKLRMNRYLNPIATSTPTVHHKGTKGFDLEEHSHEEFNVSPELLDKKSFVAKPHEHFDSIIEKKNLLNFKGATKSNEIPLRSSSGTSKSECLSFKDEKINADKKSDTLNRKKQDESNKIEINNVIKSGDSNIFRKSEIEYSSKYIVPTNKHLIHDSYQQDNKEICSESIIGNSDSNSGKCKNDKYTKNLKETITPFIYINKEDNKTSKTNLESSDGKISLKKISTGISKSPNSKNKQDKCNNISNESVIENSDPNTFRENLTLSLGQYAKTSNNFNQQKIYPDILSSDDKKDGTGSPCVSAVNECNQYDQSSSKSIIENSDPNSPYVITSGIQSKNFSSIIEINTQGNSFDEVCKEVTNVTTSAKQQGTTNSDSLPVSINSKKLLITNDTHDGLDMKSPTALPNVEALEFKRSNSIRKSHVTFLNRSTSPNMKLLNIHDSQNTKSKQTLSTNSNENVAQFRKINNKNFTNQFETVYNNANESQELQKLTEIIISDHLSEGLPISVKESQVVPSVSSKIILPKDYRSKSHLLGLKRKLRTIYEIGDDSNNSPSSEDEILEMEQNISTISSTIESTAGPVSESSVVTDTGSVKKPTKRVNTNIRKKRAKLIKENPVNRLNTSSSEEDRRVKTCLPLKRKSFELNSLSDENTSESQLFINKSHASEHKSYYKSAPVRNPQQKIKEDGVSRNFSSLKLSSDNEANNRSVQIVSNKPNTDKKMNSQTELKHDQSLKIKEPPKVGKRSVEKSATASNLSSKQLEYDIRRKSMPIVHQEKNSTHGSSEKEEPSNRLNTKLNSNKKSYLSNKLDIEPPSEKDLLFKPSTSIASNINDGNLSDSSSSMIEPSPNILPSKSVYVSANLGRMKSDKTLLPIRETSASYHESETNYSKSRSQNTWSLKIEHIKEKSRSLIDKFSLPNKTHEKSQKSNHILRENKKCKNKENTSLNILGLNSSNTARREMERKIPRVPLRKINFHDSSNEFESKEIKSESRKENQDNLPNQKKTKNVKSSVVRWVGNTEVIHPSNSPEVNTLLRRTYFMGNN